MWVTVSSGQETHHEFDEKQKKENWAHFGTLMRDMVFNKFQNDWLLNHDTGDEQKAIIIQLNMDNLVYDGTDPGVLAVVQFGQQVKGYNYQKLLCASGATCPTEVMDVELSAINVGGGGGPEKGMCAMRFNSVHHYLHQDKLDNLFDAIPRAGAEVLEGEGHGGIWFHKTMLV